MVCYRRLRPPLDKVLAYARINEYIFTRQESPDFHFHDLRHTFASRLAMAGVDLYTVQRAGGWKTAIMVQRYAHLSPDHIRAAVERLAQNGIGTKIGTGALEGKPGDGVSMEEDLVTRLGIEPRTPGLKGRYSAN